MKEASDILSAKSVRETPVRLLLLEYFISSNGSFALSELEILFPRMDRITIYRSLKTFVDHGILHSIQIESNEMKYALCEEHCSPTSHKDEHPHFICDSCGNIQCLDTLVIPVLSLPNGLKGNKSTMLIHGKCEKCSN